MIHLKLIQIGEALGVILPKEILAQLGKPGSGYTLYLTETPNGFQLTAKDPMVHNQIEQAETIMHEDRDVLRELAK